MRKEITIKSALSIVFTAVSAIAALFLLSGEARADTLEYIYYDAITGETTDGSREVWTDVTEASADVSTQWGTEGSETWYAVSGSKEIAGSIIVSGTVNLILCNNSLLNAYKGITVTEGNTLRIYSQRFTDPSYRGRLRVLGTENCAGIGGTGSAGSGTIVIHGGTVEVNGGANGAGIGGGSGGGSGGSGGNVTIYNGRIEVTGGANGAGIGGGNGGAGGNVSICGGITNVSGGAGGAGIGGGAGGAGGNVTIYGGAVIANGGTGGIGIGKGYNGQANGTLTFGPGIAFIGGSNVSPCREITAASTESITYTSDRYQYMKAVDKSKTVSYTVTFKVVNGKWDDDTSDDKIITLIRLESEDLALTLTDEDIPSAGNKPAAGYMTGSWNVDNLTGTTISADTAYTYTYADHPHSYTAKVIRRADCTHTGIIEYTCSCRSSYRDTIPMQSHDMLLQKISTLPTETTEGKAVYVCKRCGYTEERSVPVLTEEDAGSVVTLKTQTVSVTGILDGKTVTVSVSSTYDSEVTYSGKKFSPKKDIQAVTDLSGLTDHITTNGKYSAKSLFKVTYVSGNNKKAGTFDGEKAPYYYLKIKLNEKKAKKAGLSKNSIKELKALLKALNLSLKEQKCFYTIRPVNLDQPLTVVKIKGKIKKGKIKEISYIKVSAYVNGKRKTFKLSKKKYPMEIPDPEIKTIRITGTGNFEGTKEVYMK